MVHIKSEVKTDIVLTGDGGMTVGDWVEVSHDFPPGHNSEGVSCERDQFFNVAVRSKDDSQFL
jgi:hypothetical protein